ETPMARAKKDDIMVAIQTHCVLAKDGAEYFVEKGRHLRADHPAVQANASFFLSEGYGHAEYEQRMLDLERPFPVYENTSLSMCMRNVRSWQCGRPRTA